MINIDYSALSDDELKQVLSDARQEMNIRIDNQIRDLARQVQKFSKDAKDFKLNRGIQYEQIQL